MTDDQLIDETAAAIAEELFRDNNGRIADQLVLFHDGKHGGVWSKGPVKYVIATHLTAMLEKQQEAELSAVERILYPPDEELAS